MERNEIMKALESFKTLVSEFNKNQIDIIYDGIRSKLSAEEIALYANPLFSRNQMYEIKRGILKGLSKEEIEIFAKPNYLDIDQMIEIRNALISGIPMKYVLRYAYPSVDSRTMAKISSAIRRYDEKFIDSVFNSHNNIETICELCCNENYYFDYLDHKNSERLEEIDSMIREILKCWIRNSNIKGEVKYSFNIKTGILEIKLIHDVYSHDHCFNMRRLYNNHIDELKSIHELKDIKFSIDKKCKTIENPSKTYFKVIFDDDHIYPSRYKRAITHTEVLGDMKFTPHQFDEYVKYNEYMSHSSVDDILDSYFEDKDEYPDLELYEAREFEDEEYLDEIFRDLNLIYKGLR